VAVAPVVHEAAVDAAPRALGEPPSCPGVKPVRELGRLPERGLDEVSGLVASRAHPGLLWVHNDSGDAPRVFAIASTGEVRHEVALNGAEAVDYEDIAIGPGPEPESTYLYVGDIGDNLARRAQVQIYRLKEPALGPDTPSRFSVDATRIDVRYEGGARDAEALMMDPISGDLFIVAKAFLFFREAPVGIFRVARADLLKPAAVAHPVLQLPLGPVTAADVKADGSGVAIRNYSNLFYWPRAPEQSLVEALAGVACPWPLADTRRQGEALGFSADGQGYFTVSEGAQEPLYFYALESLP